jgi:hypothetical protein
MSQRPTGLSGARIALSGFSGLALVQIIFHRVGILEPSD